MSVIIIRHTWCVRDSAQCLVFTISFNSLPEPTGSVLFYPHFIEKKLRYTEIKLWSQLEVIVPSCEHSAVFGDVLHCPNWQKAMAPSEEGLTILPCTQQPQNKRLSGPTSLQCCSSENLGSSCLCCLSHSILGD